VAAVSMEKLTKVYATGVRALDALDLDVGDGEFVVLVGPSGCGKTTALRMVAGLETITAGTLRFGGQIVNDISPRHRDVAMVFQNYALYPHLSVRQNMGFALENKKIARAEAERRIRSAADVLGLTDLLGRKPAQLSGGQRQRVAMGRAIVRQPAVFCMDEPLSNLDAKLRVQMRGEVLRVHRSIGAATLYVTHDQTEAMTMGDRVAVLRAGRLQQYGTPRELYDAPANLFVASFIGSPAMNLYEAALQGSGEGTAVVLGSQRLTLPAAALAGRPGLAGYRGRKVVAGIRPEDLVTPNGTGSGSGAGSGRGPGSGSEPGTCLAAEVRLVEPLGSEQLVHFAIDAPPVREDADRPAGDRVAEGEIMAVSAANGVARAGAHAAVRPGETATFTVDAGRLHFFDPDTGNAVT
jgi:multiple sugar transport system ATP-binding protein